MSSVAIGHDNEGDFFYDQDGRWSRFELWLNFDGYIFIFQLATQTYCNRTESSMRVCLLQKLIQIITIWGTRLNMSCCALGNLAMRSDTMITNDYDWNVIILIVADFLTVEKFSTIITIATTDLKICWDLTRFIRLLYD